jgi:hypothetical protein
VIEEGNIIMFLKAFSNSENISGDTDLFLNIDDLGKMLNAYASKYKVDMKSYLWYFHENKEGDYSVGGIFFKPPHKRVERIAVTPDLLLESANKNIWMVSYPPHQLPKYRYDLIINKIFIALVFLYFLIILLKKFVF